MKESGWDDSRAGVLAQMSGERKEEAGSLRPDDGLWQEHQVLVLQFCRSPKESKAQVDGLLSPWWGGR